MADCRIMPTRKCPKSRPDGCGKLPCARFESDDETPWTQASEAEQFPPGCNCERISADTSADVPGTKFVRGRSDPPCKVHWSRERSLYDVAWQRGYDYATGTRRAPHGE